MEVDLEGFAPFIYIHVTIYSLSSKPVLKISCALLRSIATTLMTILGTDQSQSVCEKTLVIPNPTHLGEIRRCPGMEP